jgi:hypothetical protein
MPLYKGTIHKRYKDSDEPGWSNVYLIDAIAASNALAFLNAIRALEQAITFDVVEFYYNVIHREAVDGETLVDRDVVDGDLHLEFAGGFMPLFNCIRVDFYNEFGRPEVKYLRTPLPHSDVDGAVLKDTTVSRVEDDYMTPLLSFTAYVGPGGEAHTGGVVHQAVQMRQTNWHRRTRPGYKRGWVPV